MKKSLLLIAFLFTFSHAAITLKSVSFSNYEENASTYMVSYSPYQDFINLGFNATQANYVMTCRNNATPTLTCASTAGLTTALLMRLKENSHFIYPVDKNVTEPYFVSTNLLGMSDFQYNFLFALTGIFCGFVFYLVFSQIVAGRK